MKAVIRYLLCVLLSAIGWCGALANILHYAWLLHLYLSDASMRHFPSDFMGFYNAFGYLLPIFLCAAVAMIAWHFREKRPTKEEAK